MTGHVFLLCVLSIFADTVCLDRHNVLSHNVAASTAATMSACVTIGVKMFVKRRDLLSDYNMCMHV